MAQQEVGHAQLIANMLNSATNTTGAPGRCTYAYDFETVPAFLDFCQRLTRWGESGVLGFLSHLNARPTAQLLVQSITTESRQQMIFRCVPVRHRPPPRRDADERRPALPLLSQMMGLFPMPVYFEVGIPQAYAWSLLNPYIVECPATNSPIKWQAFPALTVENGPSAIDEGFQALPYPDGGSAVSHNRTALTYPGREVELSWAAPGYATGPYNQTTAVGAQVNTNASSPVSLARPPPARLFFARAMLTFCSSLPPPPQLFVAWVSQLNVTYTPLTLTGDFTGTTYQPNGTVFPETPDECVPPPFSAYGFLLRPSRR